MGEYNFTDAPNTACITCKHILDEGAEILFVSHDSDDRGWQFLCSAENHQENDAKVVGLGEIVKRHPELNHLFEMPLGICGERTDSSHEWKFYSNE